MGIRGLSSLLSEQQSLFKPVELHHSCLVIDGNNISMWLYQNRCSKSVFNGNYNEYKQVVKIFFYNLRVCDILPIVILDGAHEERKLNRTRERMEGKIRLNGRIMTIHPPKEPPWPALLKEVFKNILDEENILYIQCLLEADVGITKAAQLFECPVLSRDGDYYLTDVSYIPLDKFYMPKKKLCGQQNVINAKQFDRSKFFDKYGNLHVKFLPMLSFLLGNDYSETSTFKHFYAKRDCNWSQLDLEEQIISLMDWLRTFNSPNNAVNDLLATIPDLKLKDSTRRELSRCLTEQNSDQERYLVHSLFRKAAAFNGESSLLSRLNIQTIDESSWLDSVVEYIKNKIPEGSWTKAPIPRWILKHHIMGELPREVMDIMYSRRFFFTLQIEDHSKESVTARMLEIFQNILGIIYYGYPEWDSPSVIIYIRQGDHLTQKEIIPQIPSILSCGLAEIPSLSASSRKKIALDVLKLDELQESVIPPDWDLFFLTLADWYKDNQADETAAAALGCLLFSGIFVKVIDEKVPNHTDIDKIRKDYADVIRKRQGGQGKRAINGPFSTAITNVDLDDCKVALWLFSEFRDPFKSEKISPRLNKVILHYLALFQLWTILVEMLNSILKSPFSSLKIENFFCGTFTYNIYFYIKQHADLQSFIDFYFEPTPTLQALFRAAVKVVEKLSKCSILPDEPLRKRNLGPFEISKPHGESSSRLSNEHYQAKRKRGSRRPKGYYQSQRKRGRWHQL